jgi:hypothetical protein
MTSLSRERRIEILGDEKKALWPLIDLKAAAHCAQPRKAEFAKGYARCFSCKQLTDRYGPVLDDLLPITYSTKDWTLGRGDPSVQGR